MTPIRARRPTKGRPRWARIAGAPLAAALVISLAGCATKRPVLYPNTTLERLGSEQAERDIEECIELAESSGADSSRTGDVAGSTAGGAAVGGAGGAVGGAVLGSAGRGAGAGAAIGATTGFLRGLFRARDPDPIHQRFVEQCLRERGYQPIGWR